MGKTAPPKKKGAASVHSRAAKRASSPSINTDKSLKEIKAPEETKNRPSVLAVHQGAGVSKKSKNGRKAVLSAKAKRRQEKGLDRAEAVMDKKEIKIEKSRGKARNVQERAKAWEELNKKMIAKKLREEALDKENNEDEDWEDNKEDIQIEGTSTVEVAEPATIAAEQPVAMDAEDEEEIL
ncbi:hypothetical protein BP6252_00648 [Coleophoma cylindrospora]|uniref:Alb1-domain-containing protein n=1 Tax=Coleophoma cylindrospora TaxID=1849047 RepID=A0A3D8SQM1_9HELO|nr:hypothetical protein BP6252_00648 [Coleophoma cylindrospora]